MGELGRLGGLPGRLAARGAEDVGLPVVVVVDDDFIIAIMVLAADFIKLCGAGVVLALAGAEAPAGPPPASVPVPICKLLLRPPVRPPVRPPNSSLIGFLPPPPPSR